MICAHSPYSNGTHGIAIVEAEDLGQLSFMFWVHHIGLVHAAT